MFAFTALWAWFLFLSITLITDLKYENILKKIVSFPWKYFKHKSLYSMYVGKKAKGMES